MPLGVKLNPSLRDFIARQPMCFVATAAADRRVNLSPKGADSLRILSDTSLRWLNLSGSGNETAGHLRQVNRMTMMFCAFDGEAMILRLYGTAQAINPHDAAWDVAIADFSKMAGSRQVFDLTIESVNISCGTGVPVMQLQKDRVKDELLPYFDDLGPTDVDDFWRRKNDVTIDGFDTGLIPKA